MKICFIGSGNMAQAMISGILNAKICDKSDIISTAAHEKTLKEVEKKFFINTTLKNTDAVKLSDWIILAVKPQFLSDITEEIKDFTENKNIISILPGKTLSYLRENFKKAKNIVRVMPNTPATVLKAMSVICFEKIISEEDKQTVVQLFNSFGETEILDERYMDAVTGISGSSPAYVFIMIEAMADAGVYAGLSRKTAYKLAAQSVLGSAEMVLKNEKLPAELKDAVCSPAGTTIAAVRELEKCGFRSAIIEAITSCVNRASQM